MNSMGVARLRKAALIAGVSAIAVQASAALAQDQQAQRKGSNGLTLQEVIVTAQKRAENAQDVPISISAFGCRPVLMASRKSAA